MQFESKRTKFEIEAYRLSGYAYEETEKKRMAPDFNGVCQSFVVTPF